MIRELLPGEDFDFDPDYPKGWYAFKRIKKDEAWDLAFKVASALNWGEEITDSIGWHYFHGKRVWPYGLSIITECKTDEMLAEAVVHWHGGYYILQTRDEGVFDRAA